MKTIKDIVVAHIKVKMDMADWVDKNLTQEEVRALLPERDTANTKELSVKDIAAWFYPEIIDQIIANLEHYSSKEN